MTPTRPAIPLCISEDSGGIICLTRCIVFIAMVLTVQLVELEFGRFFEDLDEVRGTEVDVTVSKVCNHNDVADFPNDRQIWRHKKGPGAERELFFDTKYTSHYRYMLKLRSKFNRAPYVLYDLSCKLPKRPVLLDPHESNTAKVSLNTDPRNNLISPKLAYYRVLCSYDIHNPSLPSTF